MALNKGTVTKDSEAEQSTLKTTSAEEVVETKEGTDLPFDGNAEQLAEDTEKSEPVTREKSPMVVENADSARETSLTSALVRPSQNETLKDLAESGFSDLEIGFGSFPLIRLVNEGYFEDTEEKELGKEFNCVILGFRAKYVLKNTKCDQKDEEVVYTYDMEVSAEEKIPLQDYIDGWESQGWGHEVKTYIEASVQIEGGDRDGEMVMLSIPPTARKRFSGYIFQMSAKTQAKPDSFVTKCLVGDKVKNVDHPFYPWRFEFVRSLG